MVLRYFRGTGTDFMSPIKLPLPPLPPQVPGSGARAAQTTGRICRRERTAPGRCREPCRCSSFTIVSAATSERARTPHLCNCRCLSARATAIRAWTFRVGQQAHSSSSSSSSSTTLSPHLGLSRQSSLAILIWWGCPRDDGGACHTSDGEERLLLGHRLAM